MGDENKQDPEEQYFLTFFFCWDKEKRERGGGKEKGRTQASVRAKRISF